MIEGSNYYIRIGLDTTKLQYTRKLVKGEMKEIIDEEQSLKVLNGHLDRLHFENLIGLECSLNFDIGTDNPKVRDFIRTFSQNN